MTNLFLPFDYNQFSYPLFFSVLMMSLLMMVMNKASAYKTLVTEGIYSLSEVLSSLKPGLFTKNSFLTFSSLFFMIFFCNFGSVFSFNFPITSQVSLVLPLAISFWLSLVLFSLLFNYKGFFSHLIPEGTPLPLTALLFLIELVGSVIRPLTLTVRLVANILAGHLLMILLSSLVFVFQPAVIFYLGLNLVEMFVAVIQAYIFTTMVVLYFAEI